MRDLQIGESTTCFVDARLPENHTAVRLASGGTYEIVAEGRWRDSAVICDADGWNRPRYLPFTSLRRAPSSPWCSLVGYTSDGRYEHIGKHRLLTCKETGELVCFANDAPFLYWNNQGELTLTIRRVG
jgi:hypothetical protein